MSSWFTTLLPVLSALLGVLVANWSSARRETIARLWERRNQTYLDIINWTLMVDGELAGTDPGKFKPKDLPPEAFAERLKAPDELLGRLWAFASHPVVDAHNRCMDAFRPLTKALDRTPDGERFTEYDTCVTSLLIALDYLRVVIREELSSGSLRLPILFRIRQRIFPGLHHRRRWRTLR